MTINKEWQEIRVEKIAPAKFKNLLEEEHLYILDVRPLNFKKNTAFIKGAFLCPLVYLAERYKEIPKDRLIVITDWAMKQSPIAAKFMTTKGYTVKGVLKGGLERWEAENLPVEQRVPTSKLGPLSLIKKIETTKSRLPNTV